MKESRELNSEVLVEFDTNTNFMTNSTKKGNLFGARMEDDYMSSPASNRQLTSRETPRGILKIKSPNQDPKKVRFEDFEDFEQNQEVFYVCPPLIDFTDI